MPQAQYNKHTNTLKEQPEMEKPEAPNLMDYGSSADYIDAGSLFSQAMMVYESHIASLRTIPCSPPCKDIWKDGQVVEEGKDYEVRACCEHQCNGVCEQIRATIWVLPVSIPIPLQPVQSEQEDRWWQIVVATVILKSQKFDMPQEIIKALKSEFHITKRQQ